MLDLAEQFQWGKCAVCNKTLTERTAMCVLIYPEEFCSRECINKWPEVREQRRTNAHI